jgi:hypothetical protein
MQIEKDGQTIEVFTPEEVQAQQQQAIEAATAPLKTELEQAKEALNKAGDKDHNFSQLRQKVETLEGQLATAEENALKRFEATQAINTANSLVKKLADGDAELEKKISFHLNRLGGAKGTPDEIAKQVRDAWVLSRNESTEPNPMDGAFTSGGASPVMPPRANPAKPALSENQMTFLRTYAGMTDEQIKKLDESAPPVKYQTPDGNFGKITV